MPGREMTPVRGDSDTSVVVPVTEPKKMYTRATGERLKSGPSREELVRAEKFELIRVAKAKAAQNGKEEFDAEKFVKMRFKNNPEMLNILSNAGQVESLEFNYYVLYPEVKTIAEFVNNLISEMGRA